MSQDPFYNQIEDYLNGNLSATEQTAFETAMQTDAALAQEVEDNRLALEALDLLVERSLKDRLQELQSAREQKERFTRKPFRIVAIAASFALLIAIAAYLITKQGYTDEALFAANYEQVQGDNNRGSDQVNLQLSSGIEAFNAGDWALAIDALAAISSEDSNFAEAQFFIGQAHLELQQTKSARTAFQYLVDQQDVRYGDRAAWLIGLSYLLEGDELKARTELGTIAEDTTHAFSDRAKQLLKKLDSFWR
ncbi:MAG: hypothetical protein AAFV80_01410 [Bacteroidota bacterium]